MSKKILSIDGGGVRGLIPAAILTEIEKRAGKRAYEMFDVITGTSTGAVITLMLTRNGGDETPYPASEIVRFYQQYLEEFFSPRSWFGLKWIRPKYRGRPAERILREVLGEVKLSKAATAILIPLYALKDEVPRVVYFSSLAAEKNDRENFLMWQVGRGATAAPTYFPAFDVASVDGETLYCSLDGGVYANNPALQGWIHAFQEYHESLPVLRRFSLGPRENGLPSDAGIKDALVVSLGTGRSNIPLGRHKAEKWGMTQWASRILDVVFEGQSDAVNDLLANAKAGKMLDEYFRLQPELERSIDLDDTDAIEELMTISQAFIDKESRTIDELVDLLTADLN